MVSSAAMYIVSVRIEVKPDKVEEFIREAMANARASRKEPGNLRFDVFRSVESPTKFGLYEVYKDEQGFLEHQKTPHYARWRERIPEIQAVPRVSDKFVSVDMT